MTIAEIGRPKQADGGKTENSENAKKWSGHFDPNSPLEEMAVGVLEVDAAAAVGGHAAS